MTTPVFAIGLDAADPTLLDRWIADGHLPTLRQLREQGSYGVLHNVVEYNSVLAESSLTELLWVTLWSGCLPTQTGYWGVEKYHHENYEIQFDSVNGGYQYEEFKPFYALGDAYRVALFDLPVGKIVDSINGVQVLAWGGHFPFTPSYSQPDVLLPQIVERYGENPTFLQDSGFWWDLDYMHWITTATITSIEKRVQISQELVQQGPWDLFLTVFGDPHAASHLLWHYSQPDHPLYNFAQAQGQGEEMDPMLRCYEAMDQGLATLMADIPEEAYVVVYSVHGMGINNTDVLSMAMLPEVMYRFNFKVSALAPGELNTDPPPSITEVELGTSWAGQVWRRQFKPKTLPMRALKKLAPRVYHLLTGRPMLAAPHELAEQSIPLSWMPGMWYSPLWPQMKIFALPAFSDGHLRVNLKGREPNGQVDPSEYDQLCDEVTELLYRLRDGRTGQPVVETVLRTRQSPLDMDPKLPDSDLVVIWYKHAVDVVDSPDVGRIGPLPYYRTGGHHRSDGFMTVKGPGIAPGSTFTHARAVDVGPTILQLMGAPIPAHFDGRAIELQSTLHTSPVAT